MTAYFVYNKMLAPVQVYNNWQGPFLTLAAETVCQKNKDADGYLCNADGSIIPIVHQYDRVPGLYRAGEPKPDCWRLYQSNT